MSTTADAAEPRKEKRSSSGRHKSGVRTKYIIESLRREHTELREENERIRTLIDANLAKDVAKQILSECCIDAPKILKKGDKSLSAQIDELAEQLPELAAVTDEDDEEY